MPNNSTYTFLHELLRQNGLGTKLTRRQGQCLFRLTVERWVLDQRVDENPHVILDLCRFHCGAFVLLANICNEVLGDLVCNQRDVRSTLRRRDRIGERDLLKRAIRNRKCYLPAL